VRWDGVPSLALALEMLKEQAARTKIRFERNGDAAAPAAAAIVALSIIGTETWSSSKIGLRGLDCVKYRESRLDKWRQLVACFETREHAQVATMYRRR
jgi:hypothetical protein